MAVASSIDGQPAKVIEEGEVVAKPKYLPGENRRMVKNVAVISIGFTLLFTAYSSMSNLQSSLNPTDGLGNWSSSVVYASMIVSSLFLPTIVIRRLNAKWTIFTFMFGYTTYIAAQTYPRFYTLLPAAAIVGISAAPMWAAKSMYLTHLGNEYATFMNDNSEAIIIRFFGIFFMAFQTHAVFGNVISSTILSLGIDNTTKKELLDPELCGANFCPGTDLPGMTAEDNLTKVYILVGIYLTVALAAAAVIGIFTDPLTRYGENERDGLSSKLTGVRLLSATFKQMAKKEQLLIIPLTIWSGLEQGFLSADYTAAYITCGWGIEKVGYVLICYGLADSFCSISFDPLIRLVGRVTVFCFAALLNVALIAVFLLWQPSSDQPYLFFIFAALWGVSDAAWQCGINAYYGVLFPSDEEASFSNYRLWESIGFVIAFAWSNLVCVDTKLYVMLGVVAVGMTGFLTIEISKWRASSRLKNKVNQ